MGLDTAIGSFLAAVGLSGAAGLNAWLPLFASALLARLDVIELDAPFDELSSTTGLVVIGGLMAADFVGDKVPAVDSVLHVVGGLVAPVSGALLFLGQTGIETDLPPVVAVVLGAVTAGSIHAGRAAARPVSTATTAGLGNPVVSLGEDAGSGVLVAAAFVLPVIAAILVGALLVVVALVVRRVRRFSGRSARRPPPRA